MSSGENDGYRTIILDRLQQVQEKNKQIEIFFHNYSKLAEQLKQNKVNREYSYEGRDEDSNSSEVIRIRQEISDLYRTKSQNDQHLIDANNRLKECDEKLGIVNQEKIKLEEDYKTFCGQYAKMEVELQKLRLDKSTISDEIIALTATCNLLTKQKDNWEAERLQLLNKVRELNDQRIDVMNAEAELQEQRRNLQVRNQIDSAINDNSKCDKINETLKLLSTAGIDFNCVLCDTVPFSLKCSTTSDDGEVNDVRWLTEDVFATGGSDRSVKLWKVGMDSQTSKICSLSGANAGITQIDYNNDRKHLIASSNDKTIRVWNTESSRLLATLSGHSDQVTCVKFYSTSSAVSGSADRIIKIWDITNQRCSRSFFPASKVLDILSNIASNPSMFVSGHLDKKTRIWDGRSSEPVKVMDMAGRVTSLSSTGDGNQILCSTRDDTLVLFDIRNYSTIHLYSSEEYKTSSDLSRCTMSPGGEYVSAGSSQGSIFIWNKDTTKLEKVLQNKDCQHPIFSISWNPTGRGVLSASKQKIVALWK